MIMDSEFYTDTILKWFQGLDYEYMVLHIMICYGLYHADNLRWIVECLSPIRKKGISKAVWVIGGVLAGIEIIRYIPYAIENDLTYTSITDKIISIFHSYCNIIPSSIKSYIALASYRFLNTVITPIRNTELNTRCIHCSEIFT